MLLGGGRRPQVHHWAVDVLLGAPAAVWSLLVPDGSVAPGVLPWPASRVACVINQPFPTSVPVLLQCPETPPASRIGSPQHSVSAASSLVGRWSWDSGVVTMERTTPPHTGHRR